jgi:alpha-amylase
MATPSEVLSKYKAVGEVDVPELGGTVSWADIERDTSCWLGNTMQWAYYTITKELEPLVKESKDEEFLKIWRYLLASDHLYYMFTAGGAPGEVHTYFNPYDSPIDAFVTAQSAILDLESRIRSYIIAANEPFLFYTGSKEEDFTGVKVWSLAGLSDALQRVDIKSIEFHNRRGDFEKWAAFSLRDEKLAQKFREVQVSGVRGEKLRQDLFQVSNHHFTEIKKLAQTVMQCF